ncbi:MobV family relaxase, partial [Bacteroides heparinolyticus]|uniref:MobV family relaxase n=1 Tax=Prevotella heparinolytica TaxID=28113 RepID=UPI0035A081FD
CADNLKYFVDTFGKENIVAAHLHRDEETPHIHVTLVPIVKGERKRRKREEQTKKRYRKKPTDTVRLCADDIMTRLKLKSYQDTYAEAMAKYGLQRGIDGSKARHKSTQQYYRDIQKLADSLKSEVVDLQQQKETAQEELRRAKKEIQTEKLKEAATVAATNIAESVGSLFGSNKVKTLERENTALHREVADHEETIEALQDKIQTMQADHSREIREMQQKHGREIADKDTRHKEEISFLKTVIAKAAAWFPYFREMLRIENLCRLVGFDERQTATLVSGKPLEYAGELYSEEHKRKFTTEKAGFQVLKDTTDKTKLVLTIDRKPIAEWFKEQFDKLRQNIRRPIQLQRKGRGMKL